MIKLGTICYKEETYISLWLENYYEIADKITLVYGRVKKFPEFDKDLTLKKIMEFPDRDKKIVVIKEKEVYENKKEMNERMLKEMQLKPGDILLNFACDEFVKISQLEILLRELKKEGYFCIKYPYLHFWRDFSHFLRDKEEESQHWNSPHYRSFKIISEKNEWESFSANMLISEGKLLKELGELKSPYFIYHYGRVKMVEEVVAKLKFYAKRRDKFHTFSHLKKWEKNGMPSWPEAPPEGGKVILFRGKHPEIIEKNKKRLEKELNIE